VSRRRDDLAPKASAASPATVATGDATRRPWARPRILYREPLEAMAAVCAPSPPAKSNPGFCPQGPISS
jgi:hypothetical protein